MGRYSILSNRKRAVIALVHTVFFLAVATSSFLAKPKPGLLFVHAPKPIGDFAMSGIYVIVTVVLLMLVVFSSCSTERLYFSFCATSASFGFFRVLLGDQRLFVAQYVRVGMLACAMVTGYAILRWHSRAALCETAELS
ncbi:MAG TPA: hypothetical protein VKW78_02320 [Terriglobales bacterium]|nr:hypothetical protein [Terriglobales bacterium]